MVPTKEQSALKKLAEIERALHPRAEEAVALDGEQNGHGKSAGRGFFGASGGGRSLLSSLAGQFFTILQPILMSAISGGVAAKAAKETTKPDCPPGSDEAYPPS
jgi:hypothetical protein